MKTRTILATLAVPATAMGLFAQETITTGRSPGEAIMIAQGAVGMAGLSSDPLTFRYFTQEYSFNGRTITGAPYSADEKTESVQTLADGTRITNSTTTRVFRDSQGRTRTEMSLPGLGGDTKSHTMIRISDPVAGTSYTLDSDSKIAHQMPEMALKAVDKAAKAFDKIRIEESIQAGRPREGNAAGGSGGFVYREGRVPMSKREELGDNVIEGVGAKGSRETSTIEAGQMGNDRPITITSERWFSPELQIEVKSVHNDPRMGQTTHTVTNISRTEPDASLFQVPSDYKLDEGKPGSQNFRYEYHH